MQDLFLEKGANLETKTFFSSTVFHVAAENGREACIKKFLHCGARLDIQDINGHTFLHLAARERYLGVVQLLLAQGADI